MPAIVSALHASAPSGNWRDERINDDRVFVDPALGLAYVVDAFGPVYGGYYAPFAIDPGLDALRNAFSRLTGSTRDRLDAAMRVAHDVMRKMSDRYEAHRKGRTGLEAAREAADAVRPPAWATFDSHAHFMGSVTACAVGSDAVVIAQTGECHAYRLDEDGRPHLLVRDHTLISFLEESGASQEDIEQTREHHSTVVVSLLGGEKLRVDLAECPSPARIALVTNGVWRVDGAVAEVARAGDGAEITRIVQRCAAESSDDASAVVIDVAQSGR